MSEKIRTEIRNQGPIPFARFMELALYCPEYGYYEKEADTLGRRGDYYTSVSVGPLFGELLARQFSDWLDELEQQPRLAKPRFQLVEAGAHKGELARDILGWLRGHRADLFSCTEYCIVEPSGGREQWQRRTLGELANNVCWRRELKQVGAGVAEPLVRDTQGAPAVRGVIFSNELLDAMPVHRFGWDATQREWFEWGVSFDREALTWKRLEMKADETIAAAELHKIPPALLDHLPDDFVLETCPAAEKWWSEAAGVLEAGKLMTIDYGLTSEEWLSPERPGGTVRAYRQHTALADVLADPGEQDLTAHVNFSTLSRIGESAGLKTDGLLTQEQFLTRIAEPVLRSAPVPGAATHGNDPFEHWTPKQIRQFQTLTHPGHLGRAFRVLIQSRGSGTPEAHRR